MTSTDSRPTWRTRTARKRHLCFRCEQPIQPGIEYREAIDWPNDETNQSGRPQRYQAHDECPTAGALGEA